MGPLDYIQLWLHEVGWTGFLDIAVISLFIYGLLIFLKRTRRAAFVLTGILILFGIYLAAAKAHLVVTAWLLQGFFAVVVIGLVVIFQEELRYFFEQIAVWSLRRRPRRSHYPATLQPKEVDILSQTLVDLARERVGALLVLRGRNLIVRHLEGGEDVDGRLSEPLLKSIFDPHSAGHDGAVVVENGRISKLGVHLPLSKNFSQLQGRGTRHTAALGLSELSDALCLVVSEERGTISAARHGELRPVRDGTELSRLLLAFHEEIAPAQKTKPRAGFLRDNLREKLLAIAIATAMWIALGYRPAPTSREFAVPVEPLGLGPSLTVVRFEPETIEVLMQGSPFLLNLFNSNDVRLQLKLSGLKAGEHQVSITDEDLRVPGGLAVKKIEPEQVTVELEPRANLATPKEP